MPKTDRSYEILQRVAPVLERVRELLKERYNIGTTKELTKQESRQNLMDMPKEERLEMLDLLGTDAFLDAAEEIEND
jgi:hypothetical protein